MLGSAPFDPVLSEAGLKLGKYKLIRRLATGGMAEIFLARATAIHGFEKLVVLKRILPQHADSEDFIRMFLAEARLAATLHHPNIVQVYDIGEEGSTYFFTMEYVAGQDLRSLVRMARKASKALPLEHILHIIMGVAAGLNHAHEKIGLDGRPLGIVHRDVSPSNVLVTYDGSVKIVDFGIAKAATAQNNTVAGTLKGKIPYMSPEQCRGEVVDRRSDIFSIGTLMWELTTGSRLFTGDNEFVMINRVGRGEVPPPTSVRGDYPPELEAIVMRALQADREQRYSSALDLQIDLEDFAREARLPVSSARMAKFMRELFAEEMRASIQMVTTDQLEEQPTAPRPALSREAVTNNEGALHATTSATALLVTEFTPSEVRARQTVGTPGPAEMSYAAGSATDIRSDERNDGRRGFVLAVVVGAIFMLGAAALIYWFAVAEGGEPTPKSEPELTPGVIVESPEGSSPAELGEDQASGDSSDSSDSGQGSGSDTASSTEGAESSTPPKDDKTESTADEPSKRPRRKTGQTGKRSGSNSSSGSKPKWDPDSPFPI